MIYLVKDKIQQRYSLKMDTSWILGNGLTSKQWHDVPEAVRPEAVDKRWCRTAEIDCTGRNGSIRIVHDIAHLLRSWKMIRSKQMSDNEKSMFLRITPIIATIFMPELYKGLLSTWWWRSTIQLGALVVH